MLALPRGGVPVGIEGQRHSRLRNGGTRGISAFSEYAAWPIDGDPAGKGWASPATTMTVENPLPLAS